MKFSGRTAAAIIEFPNNKILLIKRDTVPFKGFWALPGGKVDAGENVEQTVVREVKEETGLDVKIMRKIGEYHESGVQNGVKYDFYPACFLVRPSGGKIKRQEKEIKQIRLFDLNEIPKRLAFEHKSMIQDYAREKSESLLQNHMKMDWLVCQALRQQQVQRVTLFFSYFFKPTRYFLNTSK